MTQKGRQQAAFEKRSIDLLRKLDDFWTTDYDNEIRTYQAMPLSPHLLRASHMDVGRQTLQAWLDRDWIFVLREKDDVYQEQWRTMAHIVRLTETGVTRLEQWRRGGRVV